MKLEEKRRNNGSIQKKLIAALLPVIILCNAVTFTVTMYITRQMMEKQAKETMVNTQQSVDNRIATDLMQTIGILQNVRTSIENFCANGEEIKNYLFSVADQYPDRIPAGIYAGLTDGTYLDKMWTPDSDWVMTERPWYIDGLKSDELVFGEMYMDANTNEYIISAFCNLKNKSGQTIGVLCADVQLDKVDQILRDAKLYQDGYVFAVDVGTNLIMSDTHEEEKNGQSITELTDPLSVKVSGMIAAKDYGRVELFDDTYVMVQAIDNTNFVTVCVVGQKDVASDITELQTLTILTNVIGWIIICLGIYIILRFLLKPVQNMTDMIDRMYELDLTNRANATTRDEFGRMSGKMNLFADNLAGVVGQVKDAVSDVEVKADINANTSVQLSQLAVSQNSSIEDLKHTMSDMSGAINLIAEGATELTMDIKDTNDAASKAQSMVSDAILYVEDGRNHMGHMTDTMNGISELSLDLQQSVDNLKGGLRGINDMVNVIREIAEQTNLLSLNASIEAARAGEQGKGFAVVADEIRKLADDCSQSVVDIVETTKRMDSLMEAVISATEDSIERISDGNKVVELTNDTFSRIQDRMTEINEAIQTVNTSVGRIEGIATDMAASTEEQSANTENVLEHCEQILEIAQRFSEEGQEMEGSSRQLRELSEKLNDTIARFQTK